MSNAKSRLSHTRTGTTRIQDGEFLPGIHATMSSDHTPGHNTWIAESGGESLIIWGDEIHVQFM